MCRGGGGFLWGLLLSSSALTGGVLPARAAPVPVVTVDIRQTSLSRALTELARQAGVELLFDEALVRDRTAKPLQGRLLVTDAIAALLAGTGVGVRRTPDGAFVLFAPPASEASDGAVAEILVLGRRTQNADIRRTENDIQPYKLATRRELEVAQSDTLDEYMRGRVPANAQLATPSQDPAGHTGATRSEIDLRGLGARRTLVLVDGRRIPSLPSGAGSFDQGDLNGIPLGAIERVETLTSTAGGIYGPSAIGGVVNVVLRRDYRGADLSITSGLSDRGDAARVRVEARAGFTPNGGATDIMLFASYAANQSLYAGQRDYADRSTRRQFANDPGAYLARLPVGDAISVFSAGGGLKLDPRFGGANLGAAYTFLPLAFQGTEAQRVAALVQNSGGVTLGLAPGPAGKRASLVSNPKIGSGLFNVRQRVTDRVEAFVDGIYFTNRGTAEAPLSPTPVATLADAPSNPFTQPVFIQFPAPDFVARAQTDVKVSRFTAGMIARLSSNWRASLDYSVGGAVVGARVRGTDANVELFNARITGMPSPSGLPPLDPLLSSFQALRAALAAYGVDQSLRTRLSDHFTDASLRASGPLFQMPGGPLTLTLLGERRREDVPSAAIGVLFPGLVATFSTPHRNQTVRSGYVELRAPLLASDNQTPLVHGLEVQLAARHDRIRTSFPIDAAPIAPSSGQLIAVSHQATTFTVGARVFPARRLMLRGSVATGQLPPDIDQLLSNRVVVTSARDAAPDPKRGGQLVGVEGSYVRIGGGSHRIGQEEGRTISFGAVLNPTTGDGPRLSVDYSRIDTRREIISFPLTPAQLLASEASYADRVGRLPLTAEDASQGFTAGRVVLLDLGAINAGRATVEAIDFEGDWTIPAVSVGRFRVYASATWQPTARRQVYTGRPWVDRIGYSDGPLKWRGNAGIEWVRGPLKIDLNAQFFHSYRVIMSGTDSTSAAINEQAVRLQGGARVPAQVYVDLVALRRFTLVGAGPVKSVEARVGVQNLFDHSPPIVADPQGLGYSLYGDPQRRRLDVMITARFQ